MKLFSRTTVIISLFLFSWFWHVCTNLVFNFDSSDNSLSIFTQTCVEYWFMLIYYCWALSLALNIDNILVKKACKKQESKCVRQRYGRKTKSVTFSLLALLRRPQNGSSREKKINWMLRPGQVFDFGQIDLHCLCLYKNYIVHAVYEWTQNSSL